MAAVKMDQITHLSDEELEKFLDSAPYGTQGRNLAMEELTRRKLRSISKPHWTLTPGFWVAVTAMIFAAIAAWPVVRDAFQSFNPLEDASFPRLRSAPATVPESKKSQSSDSSTPSK